MPSYRASDASDLGSRYGGEVLKKERDLDVTEDQDTKAAGVAKHLRAR
jgi:hypothetical protein